MKQETGLSEASIARDTVVERIYSAASGLNLWDDALAELSSYCGANASYINVLTEPDHSPCLVGAFGHAQPLIERYRTYGYLIDPTTSQILANAGHPIAFSDLSHQDLGNPAFHREFVASRRTDQVLAIGLDSEAGTLLVKLSRDVSARPFSRDAADRLSGIAHHLRQAVVIDRTLRRRLEVESFAAAIVERLRAGVVRLDARLKVTFANQAAYRLAAEGDVIVMVDDRLRFVARDAMETLRGFIRRAESSCEDLSETILLVGGEHEKRTRIWAWSSTKDVEREFGLVILPEDYDPDLLETMLRRNYGLTPSEIRTAIGVISHNGLAAVAEHTGVSIETVRFHVKRIFSKTGTNRQAELVRVIANDLSCIDPAYPLR